MRCLFLNLNETLVFLSKQKCKPRWILPNNKHSAKWEWTQNNSVQKLKNEKNNIQLSVVSNSNSFLLTQIEVEMETHKKWFLFILINTNRENLIEDRQKRENTIHFFALSQTIRMKKFTAKINNRMKKKTYYTIDELTEKWNRTERNETIYANAIN